jgi:rare lipoprotein A
MALLAGGILLASCAGQVTKIHSKYGAGASVAESGQPVPNADGYYHLGKPYIVAGRTYVPEANPHYSAIGFASWYGPQFHGRYTANGEVFNENEMTAAHPTLPLPSYVRVTNLTNQKTVVVRVNDRGPFAGNRVIDLSKKTAQLLGFYNQGLAKVKVDYIGPAPLTRSQAPALINSLREGMPSQLQVRMPNETDASSNVLDSRTMNREQTHAVSGFADDGTDSQTEPGINVVTSGRGLY